MQLQIKESDSKMKRGIHPTANSVVIVLFALLLATSCKDDDKKGCNTKSDCGINQICLNGKCTLAAEFGSDTNTATDTDTPSATGDTQDSGNDTSTAAIQCTALPTVENAQSCSSDCECYSGHCSNGFCCETGTCCAVATDCPQSACFSAACTTAQCSYSTVQFPCGSQISSGANTCSGSDVCNGSGQCVPLLTDCGAYKSTLTVTCSDTLASTCFTSCTADNQNTNCADGYHCENSACVPNGALLANGGDCSTGAECLSGYCGPGNFCCVEGLCCESDADCDNDDQFCNGVFLCQSGVCNMNVPIDDPCPVTSCNPQTCDEANDTCQAGADPCYNPTAQCETQDCVVTGPGASDFMCETMFVDDGVSCNDGDVCNGSADRCVFGVCQPGPLNTAACFDNDPCTTDSCTAQGSIPQCSNFPVAEGAPCTSEFSCFGAGATCEMIDGTSNMACIPKTDVCPNNGICQYSTCEEVFSAAGNTFKCNYDTNPPYKYLNCSDPDSIVVYAKDFLHCDYFDYNDNCNPMNDLFAGKEAQVILDVTTAYTSATVSIDSIDPPAYNSLRLMRFDNPPCDEQDCVAFGTDSLVFPISQTATQYRVVLETTTALSPPTSVTLHLDCTP
ncbi:MAG: hypothetical protein JXR76_22690 [Deltaproteobacteria bacterium]|nr:hypothetical protein [Deltaproteobacteria bacterium]